MNKDFPFIHYSVNYDYEKPITFSRIVSNQSELDEVNEECVLYGYSEISEAEYTSLINDTFFD